MGDRRRGRSDGPCDKTSYPGRRRARHAAKLLTTETGELFRPYYCPECRKWHVTRQQRFVKVPISRHNSKTKRGRRPEPGQSIEDLAEEMKKR
jgi:hypothetical protein